MKLHAIKNALTSKAARQVLVVRKNSPTILFAAGVTGAVAATVVACRATLKAHDLMVDAQKDIGLVRDLQNPDYSEQDRKHDLTLLYARTGTKLLRVYAPAISLGVASVACLYSSHRILNTRNAGLVAAYAALDRAFAEYRDRVVAEVGEDRERELRHESILATAKKDAWGQLETGIPEGHSIYARLFDEFNSNWTSPPEYNMIFLRAQQNFANDLLQKRGHVFLNDIYDSLGMERTKAGAIVGWLWKGDGDNYIDFGIFDGRDMNRFYDFVVGNENSIWLDFNVDGVIYDKI